MTLGKSQVNLEYGERLTSSSLSGLRAEGLSKVEGSRLLNIHEFAKVCRTTPRTLRFYEQKGLFKPAVVDKWTKYRFYKPEQARDFLKIKLLQNFHIPLNKIKISKKTYSGEKYLEEKLEDIKEEIEEKEKEYKFLQKIKDFLFKTNRMTDNIFQTKTFGPFNLFCMKVEHGEYAKITDYIKTLWKEAKRLKLNCEDSEITFYLNNAYNPKNTSLEIALILTPASEESLRNTSEVARQRPRLLRGDRFYFKPYPKTKVLTFEYIGPYEYMILVYQKLFYLIETQKINLKGLVFDIYKYGPLNTKSKYDYQTTIGFPI